MTRKRQNARKGLRSSSSSAAWSLRAGVDGVRVVVFVGDRRVGHGLLDGGTVARLCFSVPIGAEARRVLEDRILRAARR